MVWKPRDYATQIFPDQTGHEGCGPAVVTSVQLSAGWDSDPFQLYVQNKSIISGNTDAGTDANDLVNFLRGQGFDADVWTSWKDAVEVLSDGGAILYLHLNQYKTPRPYPNADGWDALHWSRLYQLSGGGDLCVDYDPLTYLPQPDGSIYQGPVVVTTDSLRASIRNTPYDYAGVYAIRKGVNLCLPLA